MAHTNSTTNYSLPQFLSTDKPAWLTDVNPAYEAIDTGMHNAQIAADAAQADATQALDDAAAASGAATTADAKGSGAVASLAEAFDATATYSTGEYVIYNNLLYVCTSAVVTPGPWTGSTNWNRTTLDAIATGIKTDIGNIKIEDLANVSLSTSDNNTLLGVSVSGDSINVSAVNPLNGYEIYNIDIQSGETHTIHYNIAAVVFCSRGGAACYLGHWTGVDTLVNNSNYQVTYNSSPMTMSVKNLGGATARLIIIKR